MIAFGKLCNELQEIKDEMTAADLPIGELSPAEMRAELEARGLRRQNDREQEFQRRKSRRRLKRHYSKKEPHRTRPAR
jgi:hypothetical protein